MKNELHLLKKKILVDKSEVLLDYQPDENWQEHFMVMDGTWELKDGWLVGTQPRNRGGILFSRQWFDEDVMFSFTAASVLPATRDVNAVFCAEWNHEINRMGNAYVCGLNGWYEGKSGIERNRYNNLYATTSLYHYEPGSEVHMRVGAIDGHCFMFVDDVLVSELVDPNPLHGGHVGFTPFCTRMKVRDLKIQRIAWEEFKQHYDPEFEV